MNSIIDLTLDDGDAAPGTQFSASRFQSSSEPAVSSSRPLGHRTQNATPSKPASSSARLPFRTTPTPKQQQHATMPPSQHTPHRTDWTVRQLECSLLEMNKDVDRKHAQLVMYSLKTSLFQKPPQRRHLSATADLADLKLPVLASDAKQADTMKVQFKLHGDKTTSKKTKTYPVTCIKSDKERVPRYRFHHIELSRNVLSPNTGLQFVPHLRDMEKNEEERYRHWINELEMMDAQSGFNATSSNRAEKATKMLKNETTIELSLYIGRWIAKLGLSKVCSKSVLARYIAQHSDNSKMTPQQKTSIINRHSDDTSSPRAVKVARTFTEAFNKIWEHMDITLEDVLVHDETMEAVTENKKLIKDGRSETEEQGVEQLVKTVNANLESYTILGCLYCYAHSCEHGYHDTNNRRAAVGTELIGGFGELMKQNIANRLANPQPQPAGETGPCRNRCFLQYRAGNAHCEVASWSEEETKLLQGFYVALAASNVHLPCLVSSLVGRFCWEVYRETQRLGLDDPKPILEWATSGPPPPPKMKALPWYDRFRKELKHDWDEQLLVHKFNLRELRDPCHHDGPCGKGCPCVEAKLLCERFCRCTVENCAYKFTGCACNANGKTCTQPKKEGRLCICVQLNRECDPVLCSGCGALERADPNNAHNTELHATGCQNVPLQGNAPKAVLLGESQIPGCGYGLFAAEDITQDEFVIEYLGELISHDEGVRREARRGDVFDEANHSSYLFTLLDQEGIWVDAAIYGNLSRYINHASDGRKQVNVVPQILYVNGDFRIKFKAVRDIKAGEELFFNYGENFPNLTKKLLDSKDAGSPPKRERGGSRGNRGGRGRGGRGRGRGGVKYSAETKKAPVANLDDDVEATLYKEEQEDEDDDFNPPGPSRTRRGGVNAVGTRKRKQVDASLAEDSDSPPPRGPSSRGGRLRTGSRGDPARGTRGSRGGNTWKRPAEESMTTTASFALDEKPSANDGATASTAAAVHEAPRAILGTPSSRMRRRKRRRHNNAGNDGDPDYKGAVFRSGASQRSPSLRRRTRHVPDSEEDEPITPAGKQNGSDEGSAEGSSPLNRSQRRRQMPARYRDPEE